MKYSGHQNPETRSKFYAPADSGADGQGTYANSTPRTLPSDVFRSLKLERNPMLWQSLPAEKKHDLVGREDFVKAQKAPDDWKEDPGRTETEWQDLYRQKRRLEKAELRKCQAD